MRKTFILDTTQDHGNIDVSANAHQYNISFSVVHVQVCSKSFIFSCWPGQGGVAC